MRIPCPSCQTRVRPGTNFCTYCGKPMAGGASEGTTIADEQPYPGSGAVDEGTRIEDGPAGATNGAGGGLDGRQREHTFICLDHSGSTSEQTSDGTPKLVAIGRAVNAHTKEKGQIDPEDQVGLITFNSQAHLQLPLAPIRNNLSKVVNCTRKLTSEGGTNFQRPLKCCEKNFRWNDGNVTRKVIMVTDGKAPYPPEVDTLKNRGVLVYVVGVGSPQNIDEGVLRRMASTVNGELLFERVDSSQELETTFTEWAGKTHIS